MISYRTWDSFHTSARLTRWDPLRSSKLFSELCDGLWRFFKALWTTWASLKLFWGNRRSPDALQAPPRPSGRGNRYRDVFTCAQTHVLCLIEHSSSSGRYSKKGMNSLELKKIFTLQNFFLTSFLFALFSPVNIRGFMFHFWFSSFFLKIRG